MKVKNGLTETEIDEVLRVSRDCFENKGYKVYFTNAEYKYKNKRKNDLRKLDIVQFDIKKIETEMNII